MITDGEGHVLVLNSAFERLFTIKGSCLPNETVEEVIIASRFRPAYRAARRTAQADHRSPAPRRTGEFIALRADGGEFAVELSIARTSENPLQVATWIRDLTADPTSVTHTVRRAAVLQRAEELAGFGSWDWEPENQRLHWSDNLFRIHGLQPGQIVPSPEYVIERCHPDDRDRVQQAVADLARTGRCPDLRYRYVRPDGTVRHLRATVATAAESDGVVRRVMGTTHDVTEQHRAEQELAAHFAVSDALSFWEPGPLGGWRLVKDLAEALDYEVGVIWIPRGGALAAWVVWQARALHSDEHELAIRALRLRRGAGLAGSAWASAEPTRMTDLADDVRDAGREIVTRAELRDGLALPAILGNEVLAVLTFGSRRQAVITDRFMRSLVGLSYEIGRFLGRHRGELVAPALTPRELQILQLSATGHPSRQIAETLGVSQATVKTHFEHIYKKLEVHDRAGAVGEALRQGLVR